VGVVVVGVVVVGVVAVGGEGCFRGACGLVDRDLTARARILLRFPAKLRFPAISLAAPALTVRTTVPARFALATVRPKVLWFRFLVTLTCFALVVPESLTPPVEKPRTGSLNETVKRTFGCELGLGCPAARFTFTAGRVQSRARFVPLVSLIESVPIEPVAEAEAAVATAGTATSAANNRSARNRFDIGYPDVSIGPDSGVQIPRIRGGRRFSLELVTHYPKRVPRRPESSVGLRGTTV